MIGVSISELHTVSGDGINMGRGYVLAAIESDICVSEIVCQKNNDIRLTGVDRANENCQYIKDTTE